MTISLRLNNEDAALIRKYADMKGISVSELVRRSVLDQIEDEFDLKLYQRGMKTYRDDPTTYTLDEVESELSLK